MIVDVHTHTPQYRNAVPEDELVINRAWRPDREVISSVSWADYMENQAPADVSLVFAVAWHPGIVVPKLGGREIGDTTWYNGNVNDATATFVASAPDRLIGFMALHPHDPACLDELDRCRTDLGMRGVKLGANYQNFDPLEARALAIYERAQRYGLPVLFHQGTSPVREAPIRLAHPLLMDEIAMRYPDLKIIMAHMGHPWQADTCVVIRKHPNVYADVSGTFYRPFSFWEQLIRASEWNVMHKLLLGSDYPIVTVQETIDGLRNVNRIVEGTNLPRVPEDAIEAIIECDALSLLGLR
jgi:predicted TIM-barrel fold metal-dependent hydrolase